MQDVTKRRAEGILCVCCEYSGHPQEDHSCASDERHLNVTALCCVSQNRYTHVTPQSAHNKRSSIGATGCYCTH
ncbi:hypothetical protein ILYODFUR_008318 [Ilyodon furcidens]|uniref:Uncharacterized protein n=1 Tax=Ilyodon furcidens TaxID=33524 RepID=A0ABV0URD7_9TELE